MGQTCCSHRNDERVCRNTQLSPNMTDYEDLTKGDQYVQIESEIKVNAGNLMSREVANVKDKYNILKKLNTYENCRKFIIVNRVTNFKRLLVEVNKADKNNTRLYLKEYEKFKHLDNIYLLKAYESYIDGKNINFVYENVEGTKFKEFIKNSDLNEEKICGLTFQLLHVIKYLETKKIDFTDFKYTDFLFCFGGLKDRYSLKIINLKNVLNYHEKSNKYDESSAPLHFESLNFKICLFVYYLVSRQKPNKDFFNDIYRNFETKIKTDECWLKISDNCKSFLMNLYNQENFKIDKIINDNWFGQYSKDNKHFVENNKINMILSNLNKYKAQTKFQQICITYIVANIKYNKEIEDITKIFYSLDIDGNGILSFDEFQVGYSKFSYQNGKKINENLIYLMSQIYQRIDNDNDTLITLQEFIRACVCKKTILTEENLKLAFSYFDSDKSGKISLAEMKKGLSCGAKELSLDLVKEIFLKIDSDNTGTITYDEFKTALLNNLEDNI